jgi:hypothetical protein
MDFIMRLFFNQQIVAVPAWAARRFAQRSGYS